MPGLNIPSFFQKITANRASVAAPTKQQVGTQRQHDPVYMELEILDPALSDDPFERARMTKTIPTLAPGGTYRVRVSTNYAGSLDQCRVLPQTTAVLYLLGDREFSGVTIPSPRCTFDLEGIDTFVHEFEMVVAPECAIGDLTLQLLYLEAEKKHKPIPVASLRVHVEGTYNPPNQQLQDNCHIALDAALPEATAILHIEAPQPEKWRLTGWSYRSRQLQENNIDQPLIGLAEFVERKVHPSTIKDNIRNFSRRSSVNLIKWLKHLSECYGEHFCLIIVDQTGTELPWEMLELDDDVYLGVVGSVVRWIPVQVYDEWQRLHIVEEKLSGGVLAYLDSIEVSHTEKERAVLDTFTTFYCETVQELKQRLSQPLENVRLVYLGCHGVFYYNDKHQIAVGSLHNPSEQLVALALEGIPKHAHPRPLFFVNACHSARLIRDRNGVFGLQEVLFARAASGYIGTLGPVGSVYATRIAKEILSATNISSAGIQPAEMLRQQRRQAVTRLAAHATDENWLMFLYTFMYVYYGNPLISICLTCRETTG